MTTNEGNLLVAWFMTTEPEVLKKDLLKAGTVESMHYHDDWLWLMDVVEKIESLGFNTVVVRSKSGNQTCHIYDYKRLREAISITSNDKLSTVYQCIVKFIEWYNNEYKQSKREQV